MKYSVMTLLCFIFSLLGCEGKQDNIAVTNSYVFHVGAEIMPYSKLIKQQKIKNSNSRTAEFDQNGYVTSYQLAGLHVTIDYQAAKYFYTHNSKEFVYNLILDNDKNILAIKNDESQDIAIATYDNKGRIIKTEVTNLGEDNLKFINHISYENDLVNETTFEILITFDK